MAPCYLAFGRHLKIPMVVTVTSVFHDWLNEMSGNEANPSFVPSLFSTYEQHMTFKERLLNFLMTTMISAQVHYYTSFQVKYLQEHFGIEDASIMDLYNDVALYLINSHPSLHGIRPYTSAIVEVGGIHVNDDVDPLSPVRLNKLTFSIIRNACVPELFPGAMRCDESRGDLSLVSLRMQLHLSPLRSTRAGNRMGSGDLIDEKQPLLRANYQVCRLN